MAKHRNHGKRGTKVERGQRAAKQPNGFESSRSRPSADVTQFAGNLAMQRLFKNPAPTLTHNDDYSSQRPSADALKTIDFPHADIIRHSLAHAVSLRSVLDPEGCVERGTPAFTDGTVTHFANESPSLHVAAHEAAHQLQHAGVTNDAGLGPESHAGAVADAIVESRPPSHLLGDTGARVASTQRNYVYTDRGGSWKDVENPHFGKLSNTGETWTGHSQVAYAAPNLISQADSILKAKESGISISASPGGLTVEAPDGSGEKTLSRVDVKMKSDPVGLDFNSDCREAAREVMGAPAEDVVEQAVVNPGGYGVTATPPKPTDMVAMIVFLDQHVRALPNYESMSDEEKLEATREAYNAFEELTDEEKDKLKMTPIGQDLARELGIDQFVAPEVGEAYASYRGDKPGMSKDFFHYAAVIMVAGQDRVTLENAGGAPGEVSNKWFIETYGTAAGQTFHEEHQGLGENVHTVRVRTDPHPPADFEQLPTLTTYNLFKRYNTSIDVDERFYLEKELMKRSVQVDVVALATEDWLFDDLTIAVTAGGNKEKRRARFSSGEGLVFTVPLSALWPIGGALTLSVYDFDLIGNDMIGTVSWSAPFFPLQDVELRSGNAAYKVSLVMAGSQPVVPTFD